MGKEKDGKTYVFNIEFESDKEGWRAFYPPLEHLGASAWGQTKEVALKNIQEVLTTIAKKLKEEGKDIPAQIVKTNRMAQVVKWLLRLVLSLILVLAAGSCGLVFTFSDSPGTSFILVLLLLAGVYFVACVSIGALLNRWWFLAVLSNWNLVVFPLPHAFLFIPVALASGYIGALVRRKFMKARRSTGIRIAMAKEPRSKG